MDFVQTRASSVKKNSVENYECIKYEAPKKKVKTETHNEASKEEQQIGQKKTKEELEKEMKRTRYEVMKFAISGFEKKDAQQAKIDLAIELGAKPPKKKGYNYKIFQKIKLKEANKEKRATGYISKPPKNKVQKYQKKKDGILGVYGRVDKKELPKLKK